MVHGDVNDEESNTGDENLKARSGPGVVGVEYRMLIAGCGSREEISKTKDSHGKVRQGDNDDRDPDGDFLTESGGGLTAVFLDKVIAGRGDAMVRHCIRLAVWSVGEEI